MTKIAFNLYHNNNLWSNLRVLKVKCFYVIWGKTGGQWKRQIPVQSLNAWLALEMFGFYYRKVFSDFFLQTLSPFLCLLVAFLTKFQIDVTIYSMISSILSGRWQRPTPLKIVSYIKRSSKWLNHFFKTKNFSFSFDDYSYQMFFTLLLGT